MPLPGNASTPPITNNVTTALDMVYSEQYGSSFNRIVINSFSQGSVVVDADVIFNDVTTLPNATLSQTFTSDLSDSSSTAYKTLAETVISEVNNAAQKLYGSSFLRSIMNKFTQGSVKVDMTLVFTNKTSTPTASDATSTFSTALSSSSLDVVQGSVSAQSTSTSSSPPRPTMGSLVVFSLTLLAVALTMTN
ncbi:hypothetical protein CesoFtcFv8_009054 [Champsocephalus esox]|uniref:SEA domain-containing protein n=1 Tax=Champsocephalus esox TaxID=159716 RepID=A0AAN8C9P4_9TELE|nr:hypothetical protein CesoFtcFv8_009054 [Champsocephalus esox]